MHNKSKLYGDYIIRYSDSIQSQKDKTNYFKKIIEFSKRNAIEKKQIELQQKQKELQISALEKKRSIISLILAFTCFIVILLLIGLSHYRKQRNIAKFNLQQKINLEQKVKTIETSIAADLHDNFGNRISGMVASIDIVKDKLKIHNVLTEDTLLSKQFYNLDTNFRGLISDVKDMLWANQPKNNTSDALFERIQKFTNTFNTSHSKQIKLEQQWDENYPLTFIAHKQIFFALKEMVHNFDKYAKTEYLYISATLQKRKLKIKIKDQGIGFKKTELKRINGLNNIVERMGSIDLVTQINAVEKQGVEIIVEGFLLKEKEVLMAS